MFGGLTIQAVFLVVIGAALLVTGTSGLRRSIRMKKQKAQRTGKILRISHVEKRDEEGNVIGSSRAIDEVDLDIKEGQFIAILGHNGSGKSTLAKHINAILVPTGGTIWVDGKDTKDPERTLECASKCGNGISESGQSDHWHSGGRGCGIRTGKSGRSHR